MRSLMVLVAMSILASACSRSTPPELPPGPEGVTDIVAGVRGLPCPTCAAAAEAALRQRLPGVATISISESEQTIAVSRTNGAALFSPAVFRDAVRGTGIEVLTFHVDACGIIEGMGSQQPWFVAGKNRFALKDLKEAPTGELLCVSGRLDDQVDPYRLTPTAIRAF